MQQSFNQNYGARSSSISAGFFGFNLKTIISIFVFIEALTAVILFGIYLYFFNQIASSLGATQADGKAIASFLLAIITYLLWKTLFAAYTMLNFIKTADYNEISANRYIFAALSLTLGGIWTPFILTALPNTNVRSTINPRSFLVKTYGFISTFGALIALASYFVALTVGINGLNSAAIFTPNTIVNTLTFITLGLNIALSLFGALSIFSWNKNKQNVFNGQQNDKLFRFVSVGWLIIVSAELVLAFTYVIVRFLGLLSQTFNFIGQSRNSSGAAIWTLMMFPILMINIMFQLLYVCWFGYVIHQTIVGLWQPEVTYKTFESLANYKAKRAQVA